ALGGIAFDTGGAFGYRILVTGTAGAGKTEVAAIDCAGTVSVITSSAPTVEGGLEIAPPSFGAFGGMLIAPDELSGNIYAIGADGTSRPVAQPSRQPASGHERANRGRADGVPGGGGYRGTGGDFACGGAGAAGLAGAGGLTSDRVGTTVSLTWPSTISTR